MKPSGATFSDDRAYRYALWRIWNEDKPLVMFIGLNPSTANETKPDRTITRVTRFAYDHGYGGFYMMNLFAVVSTDPKYLLKCADPLGENDYWLEKIAIECEAICFVWGAFKQGKERSKKVAAMFPGAYCLRKTKGGFPEHPLYIPGSVRMVSYSEIKHKEEKQ